MPLNTVQSFVQQTLDGLTLDAAYYPNTPQLTAYINPPVPGDLEGPTVYVWGGRARERRQTMGRPSGFKVVTYDMLLYIMELAEANDPDGDHAFATVIDAIAKSLRTVTISVPLTDPDTGEVSQLLAIGEKIDTDQDAVRSVVDQRYVRHLALMTVEVKEQVVG